jgi:hypothetical protein
VARLATGLRLIVVFLRLVDVSSFVHFCRDLHPLQCGEHTCLCVSAAPSLPLCFFLPLSAQLLLHSHTQ